MAAKKRRTTQKPGTTSPEGRDGAAPVSMPAVPVNDHGGADQMSDDYDPHPGHPQPEPEHVEPAPVEEPGQVVEQATQTLDESEPDTFPEPEHAEPEHETFPEPENDEPMRWEILRGDPGNPFTSQLIFTEGGEDVLWWELDPITLNTLISALNTVKSDQTAILTGIPEAPVVAANPAAAPSPTGAPVVVRRPRPAPEAVAPSWFARHRILSGLLIMIVIFVLIGFVFGGTQV